MERWSGGNWQLPALSGLLLAMAYHLPLLIPSFVAFVPLLYWSDAHPRAGRYAWLRAGFIFGFVFYLLALHFLLVLTRFSWLAVLLYVGFAAVAAIRVALVVTLAGWLRSRCGLSWGLLLPVSWLPLDWLQTFGDLRMAGDHIGYSLAAYPFLIQFADLVGHYGVGAFVLCANGLLYEATIGRHRPGGRRAAVALGVLLLAVLGYDAWSWNRDDTAGTKTLRVAIVQPNIPLDVKWDSETAKLQWETLERLSRRAGQENPDLIVWPESARPFPLYHWLDRPETYRMAEVQALARELGSAFLVGAEYYRVRGETDFDLYNAAMAVNARGEIDPTWVAKVYLVPFAEATPFRSLLGPLIEDRGGEWRWMAGAFEPGPRDTLLDIDGARVGVLVCFEQLFPDLARGCATRAPTFRS